jgi:hypothetical protein
MALLIQKVAVGTKGYSMNRWSCTCILNFNYYISEMRKCYTMRRKSFMIEAFIYNN